MAVDVDMVLQLALKLSSGLPSIEWTDSSANVNAGCWISWKLQARQLRSGHIAIAFEAHVVTFRARSNPLWEFMGIDPNDSAQEVLRVLGGIVAAMPPVQTVDISLLDAALGVQDLLLLQTHPSGPWHGASGKCALLLLTCFSVWLLWKCRTVAPDHPPLTEIDISTPQWAHQPSHLRSRRLSECLRVPARFLRIFWTLPTSR